MMNLIKSVAVLLLFTVSCAFSSEPYSSAKLKTKANGKSKSKSKSSVSSSKFMDKYEPVIPALPDDYDDLPPLTPLPESIISLLERAESEAVAEERQRKIDVHADCNPYCVYHDDSMMSHLLRAQSEAAEEVLSAKKKARKTKRKEQLPAEEEARETEDVRSRLEEERQLKNERLARRKERRERHGTESNLRSESHDNFYRDYERFKRNAKEQEAKANEPSSAVKIYVRNEYLVSRHDPIFTQKFRNGEDRKTLAISKIRENSEQRLYYSERWPHRNVNYYRLLKAENYSLLFDIIMEWIEDDRLYSYYRGNDEGEELRWKIQLDLAKKRNDPEAVKLFELELEVREVDKFELMMESDPCTIS